MFLYIYFIGKNTIESEKSISRNIRVEKSFGSTSQRI